MRKALLTMLAAVGLTALAAVPVKACTSYYVGSDLTEDGSTLFGRTEDIGSAYDKVFQVIPSKDVPENRMWTDESGATQFTAPYYNDDLTETYRYTACRDNEAEGAGLFGEVGVNEKGVSMSATTTAGNSEEAEAADPFVDKAPGEWNPDPKDITGVSEENYVDYVLCQASTAKQGVEILAKAIEEKGVSYTADGVFIADKDEVWYFEILSGSQYCAIKMPSDKAALIPNCLVIGDVDLDDTENVFASDEVKTLAEEKEIYVPAQTNPEVNDINIKLTYGGNGYSAGNADRIRAGQFILTGNDNTDIYTDNYQDIFFDIPTKDVTVEKLYQLAGSQYEEYDGVKDFNEARPEKAGGVRYIGVSSSAECHIMQIRSDMPAQLATVEWLSLSSAAYAPMVPFYSAVLTDVPEAYKEEAPEYSDTSAYWIYQSLGKYVRQQNSAVQKAVKTFYKGYVNKLEADQKSVDKQMMEVYNSNPSQLEKKATDLGISIGNQTVEMAKKLNAEVMSENYTVDFATDYNDINYSLTAKPAEPEKPSTNQPQATSPQTQTVAAPARTVIKKLKNRNGRRVQVKFKKVAGADGYEIVYSTGVNFGKKKTKAVSYNASKNIRTIKKLKKGRRYFVKVRAYKMNGTKKVYGKWSPVKVIRVKK